MVEKIPLENGLVLEVWDYSRKLAGDRWLVGMLIQIGITPTKEDFSDDSFYQEFLEKTEGKIYYRYRKERHFVPEDQVFEIFSRMKENFLKAALPYLSHADFKQRLIKQEVSLFEKRVKWERYVKEKEEEAERLEELWKDRKVF